MVTDHDTSHLIDYKALYPEITESGYDETMKTRIPAFAYLRVSGKGQLRGDGFPRQRAAIERYARAHGYNIQQWFEERAVCGDTEWTLRPSWSNMLGSLNGVRTIFVEKVDRLARDLGVQEIMMRDLKQRDVKLLSASEEDLDSNPTRVLIRQIFGAFAQYDRAMLVLKLRGARRRKRIATGRCEGDLPYGVKADEAAVAERMRALRAQKVTFAEIADRLNEERTLTRKGKLWKASYVQKMLKRASRPAYLSRRSQLR
jgi:DNA invertase Pin-like site-specific DNA recombinase